MKCPYCGHDLPEGTKFCTNCGGALPAPEQLTIPLIGTNSPTKSRGRAGAIIRALIAVVLYLFLMLGIQSCVTGTYMASTLDMTGMMMAVENGNEEDFAAIYSNMMQTALNLVTEHQVLILLISNLASILVVCLLFRLRRRRPVEEFALYRVNPLRLVQFALFGAALNLVISVVLGLLPLPDVLYEVQESQYAGLYEGPILLSILSVAVVGPITEEIFFRGIPMTRLEPLMGGVAVTVTALLFGLAHGTPIAIGYAFVIGLVLAFIYRRYHSILPCIITHCFFNLSSFFIPEDLDGVPLIVCVVLSAAVIGFVWVGAVARYPAFGDVVWDFDGRITTRIPWKEKIISAYRRDKNQPGADHAEIQEKYLDEWIEAEENAKKGKDTDK